MVLTTILNLVLSGLVSEIEPILKHCCLIRIFNLNETVSKQNVLSCRQCKDNSVWELFLTLFPMDLEESERFLLVVKYRDMYMYEIAGHSSTPE